MLYLVDRIFKFFATVSRMRYDFLIRWRFRSLPINPMVVIFLITQRGTTISSSGWKLREIMNKIGKVHPILIYVADKTYFLKLADNMKYLLFVDQFDLSKGLEWIGRNSMFCNATVGLIWLVMMICSKGEIKWTV